MIKSQPPSEIDVLIIGTGLSGISMAGHLGMMCPEIDYMVLERRDRIGGTWDQFRYPGVRSDSDMHTLGFDFEPWKHEDAIADGHAILDYLNRIVEERRISENMHFGFEVVSADWDSSRARWIVTARGKDGTSAIIAARLLYFASGYYDDDNPHDADLPGLGRFGGQTVDPQFWPEDLDYQGKDVVVIGSGATAVTIVSAMADTASSVTMLQRTPSWMAPGPRCDTWGKRFERWFPEKPAYWLTRQKNIALRSYFFGLSRRKPRVLAEKLRGLQRGALRKSYEPRHFEPPYNPWQQRLCLMPDGNLFTAMRRGHAHIVTDRIAGFDDGGVKLQSGDYTSGYLERAKHLMPKVAAERPWTLRHNYREDKRDFRQRPVADGVLRFVHASAQTDISCEQDAAGNTQAIAAE